MFVLVILFFITALVYASVGFGGGSTYNALLVLSGVDYRILPAIALICNIIVVAGGVWRFALAGRLPFLRLAPWMAASIPAAWLGGRLPVSEALFVGLLGFSLLFVGVRLLTENSTLTTSPHPKQSNLLAIPAGASLGLLSGVVGVGGGIFLAPILHFLRWSDPKTIAGACSLFILVNSASGLTGQLMKLENTDLIPDLINYWPLLPAVLLGGQIGSFFAAGPLPAAWMKRLTAVLIIYVAGRLLLRWSTMMLG